MKKAITAALGAAAISILSLTGAGTANATTDPMVCVGINAASTYRSYLIDAAIFGKRYNYDTETQAKNIVDSVVAYCPQHLDGLLTAAESLAGRSFRA